MRCVQLSSFIEIEALAGIERVTQVYICYLTTLNNLNAQNRARWDVKSTSIFCWYVNMMNNFGVRFEQSRY